jgi:hypothetical protein
MNKNTSYRVSDGNEILRDFASRKEAVEYLKQYNQARFGEYRQFSNPIGFYVSKLGLDGWEQI